MNIKQILLFALLGGMGVAAAAARQDAAFVWSADNKMTERLLHKGIAEYVSDPADGAKRVLAVSLPPDTFRKDKSKRPELVLDKEQLIHSSLAGYDEMVLAAYNPAAEPIDIVFGFSGRGEHFKGVTLQPQTWSYNLFRIDEMEKVVGRKLNGIRIFSTHPSASRRFLLKDLKLVKSRFSNDQSVNRVLALSNFSGSRLPGGWVTVGAKTEIVKSGAQRLLNIVFPRYRPGQPSWPALQLWMGAGAGPTDWSLFNAFQVTLYNRGFQMIPLKMLLQDASGNRRSFDCLLAAEQTLKLQVPLRELGNFDIKRVRQIDFFIHKPEENYQFQVGDIRLETISETDIANWNAELDSLEREVGGISEERRGDYFDRIRDFRTRLSQCRKFAAESCLTAEQLKGVNDLATEFSRWLAESARQLSVARVIMETRRSFPAANIGVGCADSMTKVMIVERPLEGVGFQRTLNLELAKNEYESIQLVVIGAEKKRLVNVKVSELKSDTGAVIPVENVSVSLVGYVKTGKPLYQAQYHGWWPDPLLECSEAKVSPGEAVPFWIRIKTPSDLAAGKYHGQVMVQADSDDLIKLPIIVRVFDFALPSRAPLKLLTSFQTTNIRTFWGSDRYDEILDRVTDTLAEYKITLDSIYRRTFGKPSELELPISQLKRLKDSGMLNCFTLCYIGGISRDVTDVNDPSVVKSIDNALGTIRYWKPVLEKEGLWEYARLYGFDEMPPESFPVMAKVLGTVKREFPELPIATTAYDYSLGTDSPLNGVVDTFIPLTSRFDRQMVKKARAAGHDAWWYVCVIPHAPYANLLIEYAAIDARMLMGVLTRLYQPGGFLYYSLALWRGNSKPLSSKGPYTQWNPASYKTANGDGYLFYPGENGLLPSVRAENFRDGLEDFAYFDLLEKLLDSPEKKRHYAEVLAISPVLAVSSKEFSKDPAVLRKKRRQIAEAIEQIQNENGVEKK